MLNSFFFLTAGDINGAVESLRSFLLFYPSDEDSLDNLQFYYETVGGDVETQLMQPSPVCLSVRIELLQDEAYVKLK